MTRAERLALLGPTVVAHCREEAAAAPPPDAELIAALRPILTSPAKRRTLAAESTPAAA
ncbi:hypothetical protein ACFWTC_02960 [Streptomyces sp. NPDC058619]|uniref:hypothetical protein n=1 Tax=unclassified Streptomyces TaxID=2593676 RepID=UPI0036552E55